MSSAFEQRAEPVRVPTSDGVRETEDDVHEGRVRAQKARQRRSMVRGLIVLALLVLLASMARAGLGRVFVHGWWRL